MRSKKFYNNADRAKLRANTHKAIFESFTNTFNKIKRINEDGVSSLASNDASSAKIVGWHNQSPTVRFISNQDGTERVVTFEDKEDVTGEDTFVGTDQNGEQWSINVYYDRMTDEVQEWYLNTIESLPTMATETDIKEGTPYITSDNTVGNGDELMKYVTHLVDSPSNERTPVKVKFGVSSPNDYPSIFAAKKTLEAKYRDIPYFNIHLDPQVISVVFTKPATKNNDF